MERSDTLPLFTDIDEIGPFEGLLEESSFNKRFNTQDFREILACSDNKTNSNLNVWKELDCDANNFIDDVKIENMGTAIGPLTTAKKVFQMGRSVYLLNSEETQELLVADKEEVVPINEKSVFVISKYDKNIECTSVPSLSLQPWKGAFGFSVQVETNHHSNTKWSYSRLLKKLFLRPFDAVPIEVKVIPWIDGYINITPVYTSSQHHSEPVKRCHNHKVADQERQLPYFEHIVQLDNQDAKYRVDDLRFSVDISLGVPAPGEQAKLVYVKCGCWSTCTGGPSRKPFCLVFTLFNSRGEEVGRQILDLKVCACPVRDCGFNERKYLVKSSVDKYSGKKKTTIRKTAVDVPKGAKKIKAEPQEGSSEQIAVPTEFVEEVKRFINRLVAERYAKEHNISIPFPSV